MRPADSVGYGRSGRSGNGRFDPASFLSEPRTVLRLLSWVFSMVVFSCIVNEGYVNLGSERLLCVFNRNYDACNYGVTVGVACFLGSGCFLVLDAVAPPLGARLRRRLVLLDLLFSALCSFLWFVGFCFLANQWQRTSPDELPLAQGSDAARAAIAFCFFSILTWACLSVAALQRFLSGTNMAVLDSAPRRGHAHATPYPLANGVTIVTTNPYQAPPFTETLDPQALTPSSHAPSF